MPLQVGLEVPVTNPDQAPAPSALQRNREFLFLWSAQLFMMIGHQATLLGFPLLVLATTGSAAKAGAVSFAGYFSLLGYLGAGVVVDRVDRKWCMGLSAAISALVLVSLGAALGGGVSVPFGLIVAFAMIQGLALELFVVAEQSVLPTLVGGAQLSAAVTVNEARFAAATVAGPVLGGALFGMGRGLPFIFHGCAAIASLLLVGLIRTSLKPGRHAVVDAGTMFQTASTGFRWLWNEPFVRTVTLVGAGANVTWGAVDIVLIVRATEGGAQGIQIGAMVALMGAGLLAGALVARPLRRRYSPWQLGVRVFLFEVGCLALLGTTHEPLVLGAIAGVASLGSVAWTSVVVAKRLRMTPDHMQGRVTAATRLITSCVFPFGILVVGGLMELGGSGLGVGFVVASQIVVALVVVVARSIRAVTRDDSD
jgi:MFS family permease